LSLLALTPTTSLLAATVISPLLAYAYQIVVARSLDPASFALFTAITSILTISAVLIQALQWAIAKLAAEHAAQGNTDVLAALTARWLPWVLVLGVSVAPLAVACGVALGLFSSNSMAPAFALSVGVLATAPLAFEYGILQGLAKYGWFAIANLTVAVGRLAVGGGLLILGGGLSAAVAGVAFANLLGVAAAALPLRRFLRARLPSATDLSEVTREAGAVATAAVAFLCSAVLLNIDTVVAPNIIGTGQAAIYAAAATLTRPIRLVAAFGAYLLFQYTMRARANGEGAGRPLVFVSALVLLVDAPFALAVMADPDLVLRFTVGGAYAEAGETSRLYVGAAIVQTILSLTVVSFVARGITWITWALIAGIAVEVVGAVASARTAVDLAIVMITSAVIAQALAFAPSAIDWFRLRRSSSSEA
jgi:O-antigen/teichoic acid export membrane protein